MEGAIEIVSKENDLIAPFFISIIIVVNVYELLLILLDFISGITDSYALSLYRNIKGISLPGD